MTTINDINDFARIIREQPEWADTIRSLLLSKDLLELPVKFAEFVELTTRNFQLVYERLELLESDMVDVKADVSDIKVNLSGVKADTEELKVTTEGLKATTEELKVTTEGLKVTTEGLKVTTEELKVTTEELKVTTEGLKVTTESLQRDMIEVKGRLNNIEGKLDNALGSNYELKVLKSIGAVVGSSFRRVKVQKGLSVSPNPEFMEMLEDAEDRGVITEEQYIQIQRSDLILTGRRKSDGADVYIAAEISITLGDSDITRAAQRAEILASVVGQPSMSAVIGAYADDARAALAAANNVGVFLSPDD